MKKIQKNSLIFLMLLMLSACGGGGSSTAESTVISKPITVTKDGEQIIGKHFKCEGKSPYQALTIKANNVLIKDSLFTNCYGSILIIGSENTEITGNRFEKVGSAIKSKVYSKKTKIEYNEFKGIGVLNCALIFTSASERNNNWACDVFQTSSGSLGKFNNNLIDNAGYKSSYLEDYINIYGESHDFQVNNNMIKGSSENNASSSTGGCIVLDGNGSNYEVLGNKCYETAAYGVTTAGGSKALFQDNLVYISKEHAMKISLHPSKTNPKRGGTYGIASTKYNGRDCAQEVRFVQNRVYAYHSSLSESGEIKDGEMTASWNPWGGCDDNGYTLEGNLLLDSDPQWEIPKNIFKNVDKKYYSTPQSVEL